MCEAPSWRPRSWRRALSGRGRARRRGDIALVAGGGSVPAGDIVINGQVFASYRAGDTPSVLVAALDGAITIDGNNDFEFDRDHGMKALSGVAIRSRRDSIPAWLVIQARGARDGGRHTLRSYSGGISIGPIAQPFERLIEVAHDEHDRVLS